MEPMITLKEVYEKMEPLFWGAMATNPSCANYPMNRKPGPADQFAPGVIAFWEQLMGICTDYHTCEENPDQPRALSQRQIACAEEAIRQVQYENIFSVMHEVMDILENKGFDNRKNWDHCMSESEALILRAIHDLAVLYLIDAKNQFDAINGY